MEHCGGVPAHPWGKLPCKNIVGDKLVLLHNGGFRNGSARKQNFLFLAFLSYENL